MIQPQDLTEAFVDISEDVIAVDSVNGIAFARTASGWYYKDSKVQVPGASDRTLANEYDPRFIGMPDQEPEAVLVAAEKVEAHPDVLGWCKQLGQIVRKGARGKVTGYIVAYEDWQAHAAKPLGIVAPEFSEDPREAALAIAEREYRIARREYEAATQQRQRTLEEAIENGATRTWAAEILDVSGGRITQLLKAPELKLKTNEARMLKLIGDSYAPMRAGEVAVAGKKIPEITSKESTAQSQLDSLTSRGFLSGAPATGYVLNGESVAWYAAQIKKTKKKEEQAGDRDAGFVADANGDAEPTAAATLPGTMP